MQPILIKVGSNLFLLLLLGLIYFRIRKQFTYFASSVLIGLTTFALIYVLSKNEFGIATGIGLFAIFGIIRYRTEQVPIIEMTYLFISITISVVSAIADDLTLSTSNAFLINATIILTSIVLFFLNQKKETASVDLLVDSIDWLYKEEDKKIAFLTEKTNFNVVDFEVKFIDYLKETCRVVIQYKK
jgi:hypothetical protein